MILTTFNLILNFWGEILIALQIFINIEINLLHYIIYFLIANYWITFFYFFKTNNIFSFQNIWIIYINYILIFYLLKLNYSYNINNIFNFEKMLNINYLTLIIFYFFSIMYSSKNTNIYCNSKKIILKILFYLSLYIINNYNFINIITILLNVLLNKLDYLKYNCIVDKISLIYIFMLIITLPLIILSYSYINNILIFKNWKKKQNSIFALKIYNYNILNKTRIFIIINLIIYLILISLFTTNNLFIFFISYEATILPIILLLYFYGPKKETKRAIFYYLSYTLIGSIFLIFAIYLIYQETNTFYLNNLELLFLVIKYKYIKLVFLLFFIIFAIKIPIIPFHLWLPEAHVEASTAGSIILAALLLKIGVFGMFKFNINILNVIITYYYPLITILTLFSSIYISILIFQQNDIKKIIAYSSIIHMNMLILGLFCNNNLGIQGSTFTMFSHSLISSGLFLSIGILYKKYETRNLLNYSGFFFKNPLFSFFFFNFLIANCSFPFTSNFAGELYLLLAILKKNIIISIWLFISILISPIYSLILYTRIFLGNSNYIKYSFKYLNSFELILEEILINIFILILIISFGLNPDLIYNFLSKNF